MSEIRNAKIRSTMLGIEDHGILTCMLNLDYGGSGQGFGGYSFDTYDKAADTRKGTSYGMEFVRRVLDVVGVNEWEDLKGKHVRADAEHSKVHGIGNIIEDEWFYPEKDMTGFL